MKKIEARSVMEEVRQHLDFVMNLEQETKKLANTACMSHSGQKLINTGVLLMHLYGLIVLPWELLKHQIRKDSKLKKSTLDEWCTFRLVEIAPTMQRKKLRLYFVLEMMRNALSHATISVDQDLSITFIDRRGTKIKFTLEELKEFLHRLGDFFSGENW